MILLLLWRLKRHTRMLNVTIFHVLFDEYVKFNFFTQCHHSLFNFDKYVKFNIFKTTMSHSLMLSPIGNLQDQNLLLYDINSNGALVTHIFFWIWRINFCFFLKDGYKNVLKSFKIFVVKEMVDKLINCCFFTPKYN